MIGVFNKYAWVKPLKHKQGKTDLNAVMKIVNEFKCKASKFGLIKEKNFISVLCKNV